MAKFFTVLAAAFLVLATAAQAQTITSSTTTNGGVTTTSNTGSGGASGRQWGTISTSNPTDSSAMHAADATAAGLVNAARAGVLFSNGTGSTITITSIGSQNIVANTVYGNNNTTSINATQTSTNSGTVTTTGTVNSASSITTNTSK